MASSTDLFTEALHALIDALEDATAATAAEIAAALEKIDPRVWLQLVRAGDIAPLAQAVGIEVTRAMLPRVEEAALRAASAITGRSAYGVISEGATGRLWGARSAARAARRTASLLSDEMTTAQGRITRILDDVGTPRTSDDARAILDRISAEVVAPLREPGAWSGVANGSTMTAGNEALGAASVRLADPTIDPDTAHQIALDAPNVWVAALVKTCPDCLSRHGQIDTAANWRRRGMPRSGWSVCRERCRCQLIPQFSGGEIDVPTHAKLIEPLRRERMSLIADGTPRGLTVAVPADLLREESQTLRGKASRAERLRERYAEDIRVRRAMRLLGQINAG